MPIMSSEPERGLHQYRRAAESFGDNAERYDRARPSYPAEMVERIAGASPGRDVLDVGCGTGIAARLFQDVGCRVLGVDVDARMAEVARRGGLDVEVAKFEEWDAAGRRFDTVIAGQAWHWVDPAKGAVKAAQVLKPGGRLAAFWNVHQPAPEAVQAFAAIFERMVPGVPVYNPKVPAAEVYSALIGKTADGISGTGAFTDPEHWRFEWDRHYTRDEWLDQLPTIGVVADLSDDAVRALAAEVGQAIDRLGGGLHIEYTTMVLTAVRTDQRSAPSL